MKFSTRLETMKEFDNLEEDARQTVIVSCFVGIAAGAIVVITMVACIGIMVLVAGAQ